MSWTKYAIPFAAGVAVGVTLNKYWPQIKEAAGPTARKGLEQGAGLFDRARTTFWEQSEKFADLIAEIREEEEAAGKGGKPPETPG